jgi:hypothetical protein
MTCVFLVFRFGCSIQTSIESVSQSKSVEISAVARCERRVLSMCECRKSLMFENHLDNAIAHASPETQTDGVILGKMQKIQALSICKLLYRCAYHAAQLFVATTSVVA